MKQQKTQAQPQTSVRLPPGAIFAWGMVVGALIVLGVGLLLLF